MSDERNRKRLARLVEAIDKESPAEGLHGDDVEELYELATKPDPGEPTPDVPRYLGCASEGHWESAFRSNPDFTVGTAEELEAWLAGNYREGWAGRWVVDLETGEELSWNTSCEFDQGVERAEPKAEPAYTVVGTYGEAGGPSVLTVYTRNGPEAAMTLAHQAFAERVNAHTGELDPPQLQLVAILADAEEARLIDFDLPETWPKAKATSEPDDVPVCIECRYLGGSERLAYPAFVSKIVMGDEAAAVVARRMLDGDSPYPWNEEDPEHAMQFVLLDAEALRAALAEAEAS